MTADTSREAKERSELLTLIRRGLEAEGAQVDILGIIKGASGARHSFDLIVTKEGNRIPIDIRLAQTGNVELSDVLETYIKSLDTSLRPAVIVAMPAASSDARKSAAAFGMVLVEGKDPQESVEGLNQALNRLKAQKLN
jgi:predicted RecB family endonuclease